MIRLIATDIDGTLLNHQGQLPPENAAALREATARGVLLALVTVRKRDSTERIAHEIGVPCAKICQGGATIYDEHGVLLRESPIDMELALAIAAFADEHGIPMMTTLDERNYYAPGARSPIYQDMPGEYVERNVDAITAAPTRMMALGERASTLLSERFGAHAVRVVRHYRNGELLDAVFTAPEAAKHVALALLCRRLGLALADVLALGDSESDMAMLRECGVGVAMGDAHPPVLAAADWVAPPADEAGVGAAVRKFVLNVEC